MPKKRTKTITEIFRDGKTMDAAAKRAVRQAIKENQALLGKRGSKPRPKRRAA